MEFDGDARAFRSVKLPPFWTESPDTWFAVVEAQFEAEGLYNSRRKFFCTVATLPLAVARNANHIIVNPPAHRPYEVLREVLTAAHTLSNYERVQQIQALGPLGGRKPSELLNIMLELCPPGEWETEWFRANFLQRLPEKIRILLLEDQDELRSVAARADRFVAHQGTGTVAAVASTSQEVEDGGTVAAVSSQSANRGGFRQRGRGQGGRGYRGGHSRGGQQQQQSGQQQQQGGQQQQQQDGQARQDPSPFQLALSASGLCRTHFKYGERAFTCFPPCTWQGN